jgi:hypothetical protein
MFFGARVISGVFFLYQCMGRGRGPPEKRVRSTHMNTTSTHATALAASSPKQRARRTAGPHDGTGVPHTVWLAPPHALRTALSDTTALPLWAFERATTEYAHPGATVLLLAGPATDTAQAPAPAALAPGWLHTAETVDLPGDLPPASIDLAVVLDDPPAHAEPTTHAAPGYYRTLHTALHPRGVLLIHTHTRHTSRGLHDPAALILPATYTAGFGYLQHLVLVHHRLDAPTSRRYKPPAQRPVPPRCRRIHTDLYALTPRQADRAKEHA